MIPSDIVDKFVVICVDPWRIMFWESPWMFWTVQYCSKQSWCRYGLKKAWHIRREIVTQSCTFILPPYTYSWSSLAFPGNSWIIVACLPWRPFYDELGEVGLVSGCPGRLYGNSRLIMGPPRYKTFLRWCYQAHTTVIGDYPRLTRWQWGLTTVELRTPKVSYAFNA